MNKDRLLILAELLELAAKPTSKPKFGFSMKTYASHAPHRDKTPHECGTVACIAGWAVGAFEPNGPKLLETEATTCAIDICARATKLLGLNETQARALFAPYAVVWTAVTPQQAADAVRQMAETGAVDWCATGAA